MHAPLQLLPLGEGAGAIGTGLGDGLGVRGDGEGDGDGDGLLAGRTGVGALNGTGVGAMNGTGVGAGAGAGAGAGPGPTAIPAVIRKSVAERSHGKLRQLAEKKAEQPRCPADWRGFS